MLNHFLIKLLTTNNYIISVINIGFLMLIISVIGVSVEIAYRCNSSGDTATQMMTTSSAGSSGNRTVQLVRSGHESIQLYLLEVTPHAIARVFW